MPSFEKLRDRRSALGFVKGEAEGLHLRAQSVHIKTLHPCRMFTESLMIDKPYSNLNEMKIASEPRNPVEHIQDSSNTRHIYAPLLPLETCLRVEITNDP